MNDPEFLFKVLIISEEASSILQGIFTPNPMSRTSLQNLRQEILSVNTFFKTEQAIAEIGSYTSPCRPRIILNTPPVSLSSLGTVETERYAPASSPSPNSDTGNLDLTRDSIERTPRKRSILKRAALKLMGISGSRSS
ncbi:hypothetical protein C8J56DRAFT_1081784 [Mycena floridula]|nr:hypothetical protein C8J56DRAFT_1081784 [Mycena floridula]